MRCWCLCLSHMAMAQVAHLPPGKPLIENYSHKTYKSNRQVWALVQDQRGFMYFGTEEGLLEYDGVTWRKIATPNNKRVRSMAVGKDGTIYLGLPDDFGYLAPDPQGYLAYVSLLHTVNNKNRNFGDIWKTVTAKDKVYFITMTKTFCYQYKQLIDIPEVSKKSSYFLGFSVDDTFYQPRRTVGLTVQTKREMKMVRGSDILKSTSIFAMLPYSKEEILIKEDLSGFWLYNKVTSTFSKFKTDIDTPARKYLVYCGTALPNGLFAFGTRTHGVVIMNKAGKVVSIIDKVKGLCDNTIWSIYHQPGTQNLWVGTDNGIAKIRYNLPVLQFNESNGLEGTINAVCRFQQKLYVSTAVGAFRLDTNRFTRIKGIYGQTLKFTPYKNPKTGKNQLLVGNTQGMFMIEGDAGKLLLKEQVAIKFLLDSNNPKKAYVSVLDGVSLKTYRQGKWQADSTSFRLKGLKAPPQEMIRDHQHRLWVITLYNGVGLIENNQVTMFDSTAGLPTQGVKMVVSPHQTYFTTPQGIYVFDSTQRRFMPDYSIAKRLGYSAMGLCLTDLTQSFWLANPIGNPNNYILFKKQGNAFIQDSLTLKSLYPQLIQNVYIESNGVYWLITDEGLVCYDGNYVADQPQEFKVKVRKVTTNADSLLYAGYGQSLSLPVLAYTQNSVTFAYAALYFNFTKQNEYSYKLDGYDKQWSKWTKATKKEYTNLPEGTYIFWVKARNIYGKQSNIAKYSFKVLPPWHRSWWAKILYLVGAFVTLYGGIKLYTLRLQRQKIILEHRIMVRTREVVVQKEKIEEQNEVLTQKSEEILAQNDSLKQKGEEITAQNLALQQQSKEIIAQRNAIEATNQTLHVQNNQIIQSIRSAETIQAAILPLETRLQALFDDYFVLFRPRDVVSGDFYYLEQINDTTIVAAIDCTGHGVPGAFMSLIGYALLNEIIYVHHKTNPAEILEVLREEVRHALKQEQTKHQHGMDVTMATISPSNNELMSVVFAGAKRPLWYISPNEAQLQVIKGSNVSIGIDYQKNREIVSTPLLLPQGTILYLGSDGFADQNNEERKKFGTYSLQELLTQHKHLSLAEQHALLVKTLDDFMLGTEQRDDILLMGVKL